MSTRLIQPGPDVRDGETTATPTREGEPVEPPTGHGRVVLMSTPDVNDHVLALLPPLRAAGCRPVILADDVDRARLTLDSRGQGEVRVVRRRTVRGLALFLLARWVFVTHAFFRRIPSPPWQTLVNVWHGMPIKSVGTMDALAGQPPRSSWYTIASSQRFVPVMSTAMDLPMSRVLATGNPWCDRLVDPAASVRARQTLGVGDGTRIIVHMPTFRRRDGGVGRIDGEVGSELVPTDADQVRQLSELLSRHDAVWVSKPHPSALDHLAGDLPDNIVVATDAWMVDNDLTTYELLAGADVLVSDVSSVLIDFLVTDRPIVGWFPDLDSYRQARQLEFEPYEDEFPGRLCREWPELLEAVEAELVDDPTSDRREVLRSSVLQPGTGTYARSLVETVFGRPRRLATWMRRSRRISPGLLDQGVYAASNLVLGIAVATSVSAAAFGQFNVLMALVILVIGVGRAVAGEVLALPGVDHDDDQVIAGALAWSALLGLAFAVPMALTAFVVDWLPLSSTIIVAAFLPGLMAQNLLRYAALARGRSSVALAMDTVWLVVVLVVPFLIPSGTSGDDRLPILLTAWSLAGVAPALPGMRRLGVAWAPGVAVRFARTTWPEARPLLVEYASVGGAGQLGIVLIGLAATVETVAALRGAHLVFGLLTVLIGSVVAVGVPETARAVASGQRLATRKAALLATVVIGLATAGNLAVLLVGGEPLGTKVLGSSWAVASVVLIPVAIQKAAEGATSSAIMALRVQGRTDVGARIRSIGTVIRVVAGVVAAAMFGALGAAVTMMALGIATAVVLWVALVRPQVDP